VLLSADSLSAQPLASLETPRQEQVILVNVHDGEQRETAPSPMLTIELTSPSDVALPPPCEAQNGVLDLAAVTSDLTITVCQDGTVSVDDGLHAVSGLRGVERIVGGGGSDTLIGPAGDTTWQITSRNAGTVLGVVFENVENLQGAPDNEDTFVFAEGGSISSVVDGGAGGFDSIVIQGGGSDPIVVDHTGPDSGAISRGMSLVSYTGLEPVLVDADPGVNITYNLPDVPAVGDTVELRLVSGTSFILDSLNNTFEDTTFADPGAGATVTINLRAGDDTITVKNTLAAALVISGGTGNDTLSLNGAAATLASDGSSVTVGGKAIAISSVEPYYQRELRHRLHLASPTHGRLAAPGGLE